jgi:ATP-dependent DNA ligase
VITVDGRLSFDALQRRLVTSPAKARHLVATVPASCVAFDLLALGGVDLRTQRWTVRRRRLERLTWTTALQLSPVTDDIEEAREWFDVLPEAIGVEGLVVKGAASRYIGGRREWLKVNSDGVSRVRFAGATGVVPGQRVARCSAVVRDGCCGRVAA